MTSINRLFCIIKDSRGAAVLHRKCLAALSSFPEILGELLPGFRHASTHNISGYAAEFLHFHGVIAFSYILLNVKSLSHSFFNTSRRGVARVHDENVSGFPRPNPQITHNRDQKHSRITASWPSSYGTPDIYLECCSRTGPDTVDDRLAVVNKLGAAALPAPPPRAVPVNIASSARTAAALLAGLGFTAVLRDQSLAADDARARYPPPAPPAAAVASGVDSLRGDKMAGTAIRLEDGVTTGEECRSSGDGGVVEGRRLPNGEEEEDDDGDEMDGDDRSADDVGDDGADDGADDAAGDDDISRGKLRMPPSPVAAPVITMAESLLLSPVVNEALRG